MGVMLFHKCAILNVLHLLYIYKWHIWSSQEAECMAAMLFHKDAILNLMFYTYYTSTNGTFGVAKRRNVWVPCCSIRVPSFISGKVTASDWFLLCTIFI